jgi:hypothetical protein
LIRCSLGFHGGGIILKSRWLATFAVGTFVGFALGCGDDGGGGPANHPPVLEAQPDTAVAIGDTLKLWVEAYDADGDNLSYGLTIAVTLEELRDGYIPDAHLEAGTGYYWFVPGPRDRPQRIFMFTVEDGRGGQDSDTITVYVTAGRTGSGGCAGRAHNPDRSQGSS